MSHARLQLQELYIKDAKVEVPRPREVKLDENGQPVLDEEGKKVLVDVEPLVFYVRKMNPLQQENAARKAHAAQVHMRNLKDRPDDPDYEVLMEAAREINDKSMFIAEYEVARDKVKAAQELSDEDEWSKDGYYQSLQDAWESEHKRNWTENKPEDRSKEAVHVFEEIQRFESQLEDKLKKRRQYRAAELEEKPEEELVQIIFDQLVEQQCNQEWMRAFNVWRMIYGVVDEEKNPLFEDEDDVRSCPIEASRIFKKALDRIQLNITDVKS